MKPPIPRHWRGALGAFTLLSFLAVARADTSVMPFVAPVFADHMVLQRDQPDPIWGWAKPGETVSVAIAGRTAKAVAGADGKWLAKLTPPPVGGPYELTISGTSENVMLASLQPSRAASVETTAGNRLQIPLDADWRFHLGKIDGVVEGEPILRWEWKADDRGEKAAAEVSDPGLNTDGWQSAEAGDETFHGRAGFSWYRTVLKGAPGQPIIHFGMVDDNATVYLNGKRLGEHQGWRTGFDLATREAWNETSPNILAVLVENISGGGSIGKTSLINPSSPVAVDPSSPLSPDYDDSAWRHLNVPHDYVVEGTMDEKYRHEHAALLVQPAWYRKALSIPASAQGKRIWLEFDGVFNNSRYWLNGQPIGQEKSGYDSFRFDITKFARPGGKNELVVAIDPKREGWWYEGAGIYRHVRLVVVDPVHVSPWGVYADAQVADPGDGVKADSQVVVKTSLTNDADAPNEAVVRSEILSADGVVKAQGQSKVSLPPGSSQYLPVQKLALAGATLWSLENPYLYQLRTTVEVGGRVVDQTSVNFGVRQLRFDADQGFFLNGKPLKIQGVCCHQDHAGVGVAVPDSLLKWRLERLKEIGANAYRTTHGTPAPELLDDCDRMGILVMNENRHLGDFVFDYNAIPGKTTANDLSELTGHVKRDRNHPSVIMWSICNEEQKFQGTVEGGQLAKQIKQRIDALDGSRPVTAAMNGGHGEPGGMTDVLDLEGFNYFPNQYEPIHKKFPRKPLYGSETASEVGTRGIYAIEHWDTNGKTYRYMGDKAKGYVSAWGTNYPGWANTAEDAWKAIAEKPYMMGAFVWTGFDYKSEPTPFGWPCINSHYGIMDMCGFPKDSYFYYQSWWTQQPVLHVFPHWNWAGQEGQEINVWVYSNAGEVELFLNGASLGKQTMPRLGHLEWKVKYAPGALTAKGVYQGKPITTTVETTGAPAGIVLEPDRTELRADGADLAIVNVKIVDAQGRVVPTAANLVHFTVIGPGTNIGVGNGDPSCHEPDKAGQRSAFNGLCQVLVQTSNTPGSIVLQAEADGLKTANLKLNSVSAQ